MSIKGNLLKFYFAEEGIEQTFAINVLNISHYYFTENNGNGYPELSIYFNGRPEPELFYGGNAGVIADAISEFMSDGILHLLEQEIEALKLSK